MLYWNKFMYQTNTAFETTKFTQQSVGSVPSLTNLMDGCMSVLVLNEGPTISVCCVVYVPGPSAYQLQSLSLPSSIYSYSPIPLSVAKVCVLSHTFSTTYILCVPKGNSHLFTFSNARPHCKTRTGAVMVMWLCSQTTVLQSHVGQKSLAWCGVGSHTQWHKNRLKRLVCKGVLHSGMYEWASLLICSTLSLTDKLLDQVNV
jgi:hypothetical protein